MIGDALAERSPLATSSFPRTLARSALVVAVLAGTALAVDLSDNPVVAAVPVLLVAASWVLLRAPLRWSATGLLFLSLALDTTRDAQAAAETADRAGRVHVPSTPFAFVGDVLSDNLERILHLPGVKLTGLELALVVLLGVSVYRRAKGIAVDSAGQFPTARVLRDFVLVYVASVAFALGNGLLRGGALLIWQVRILLQIPVLFFFFQAAFRGPPDHVLIGRLVVLAAAAKAVLAIWIHETVRGLDGGILPFATSHGDSVLFSLAVVVLLAHLAERTDRRRLLTAALVPLLLWAIAANNRRIAWVELGASLAAVYFVSAWRPWKRAVTRALLVTTPVVLLYVGLGWSSTARVFAPIRLVRGLWDGRQDASTYWREVENWNIAMTMRDDPILGRGFGREYQEFIRNDNLTTVYPEWRQWPHNSVLGLLLFAGVLAFTGLWSLLAVVIFLALRSYRLARVPEDRAAALCALSAVLICVIQAFGDIGAPFLQYRIVAALALAVVGKLAVTTGAWPGRRAARAGGWTGARGHLGGSDP